MSRRSSLVALPLILLALDVSAQAPKPSTELSWAHDYDAALKTAATEKKPILFVIMKDNEIACKRMLESVYTDETVKARLGSFVLLPCSTYDHTDGASQNCTQFKGVTCAEHQAIERAMRQRFQDENLVVAPQHLVCDSSGKLLLRKLYELKSAGLIEFLDRGFGLFLEGAGGVASQPASKATESKPAVGGTPAADANAPKKLSPDLEAKVVSIVKGDEAAKESLTKELMTDSTPERRDAFLEVVARLKMNKDKEIVIRAIGYPEFASAAPAVITLLADKDALVRDCAVVTLEEMANPAACDPLVQLIKKEKDPETHKDIVRALGPCGGAKPEARAILLKEIGSSQENVRSGAALSLGYFLSGDADVEKALRSRWEKDGNNLRMKTAILWGIALSGDQAQVKLVDDLTKDDNNGQIKQLAAGVKTRLSGGDPFAGGGGGGPPKGGGRFGGGRFGILKLLAPLYADDKIVRNRIKEFRNFRGG